MDHYQIWVNLKDTSKDLEFCQHVARYLGRLRSQGLIGAFAIWRRKLGFGPPSLGEFHITISVRDLAQLDRAFGHVATRAGLIEQFHQAVYSQVTDFVAALERDFPDPVRRTGPARKRRKV